MSTWSDAEKPYPFSLRTHDLPETRFARRRTEDLGTAAWAVRGRYLHMRRPLDFLQGNPSARGRQRWRLRDSLGRVLAVVEKHSNRWDVHDPETNDLIFSDYSLKANQLEVQGIGCMADEALEASHALVAFRATDRRSLGEDESIVPFQLRAFIPRVALPVRNRRDQPVRLNLARYDVGCGGSELPRRPAIRIGSPGFDSREDRFMGEDGRRRTYATYNGKAPYGGAIYVLANTTGVHGGGIVRGVAREGDVFEPIDGFDYCDPNVAAGEPRTRWTYGRVARSRLHGWLPTRC